MEQSKKQRILNIYGVALGAYSAVVGLLFLIQVWSIYNADPHGNPYTVVSVSTHFSQIAAFVWLWLAAVAVGVGLGYWENAAKNKPKALIEKSITVRKLRKRLTKEEYDACGAKKEVSLRILLYCVGAVLCVAAFVVCLVLLLDKNYQPQIQIEFFTAHDAAVDRMVFALPWLLAALVVSVLISTFTQRSREREISLLKTAIVNRTDKPRVLLKEDKAVEKRFWQTEKFVFWLRIAVGVIGVVFVAVGIANGGMHEMFLKAINICTQCIGMG